MRLIDADALKGCACTVMEVGVADTYAPRSTFSAVPVRFIDEQPTVEVPRWIPVTERMPKAEKPVLVMYTFGNTPKVTKAIYEDGTVLSDDSFLNWTEIWEYGNYDEESDSYFIPCGWWEYGDFAEFNNVIDYPVTHWMPLPEPPEVE